MYSQGCGGSSPFDGTKAFFFRPFGADSFFQLFTHGLRRGLHSCAASRLGIEMRTEILYRSRCDSRFGCPDQGKARSESKSKGRSRANVKKAISGWRSPFCNKGMV